MLHMIQYIPLYAGESILKKAVKRNTGTYKKDSPLIKVLL